MSVYDVSPETQRHAPEVGDVVIYNSTSYWGGPSTVISVDRYVCYTMYPTGTESSFIWAFRDGSLNALHDWPAKNNPRN